MLTASCSRSAADPAAQLAAALVREDAAAVREAVEAARAALGRKAGEPEVADEFVSVPAQAQPLTRAEAQRGFTPHFVQLEKLCWWKVGLDPATIRQPLRAPASVLAGNVAVCRAKLDGVERSLVVAKNAAEFLMWTQAQAGTGVFPFPAARGVGDNRAMEVADRFLRLAEKAGKLGEVVRNGWVVDDLGDGGLQFDNGECGVAMFEYYELSRDERALASARRAADWAVGRPLVANWNYNSFSVHLLAKAFAVTGDARYLDASAKKALLGVIPGQLTVGPHAGRWLDPHNARPAYHYIMLRGLGQLAAAMPPDDARRPEVLRALALGLKARNAEIVSRGVMNKDKASETLLLIQRWFANDAAFLRDTLTTEALHQLVKLVSAQSRAGKLPLGPREWGLLLEHVATPVIAREGG